MRRTLLVTAGWIVLAAGLYLALLALDVYWNIVTWRPNCDGAAILLLGWMGLVLVGFYELARASRDAVTRSVSLVMCLALLALGVYVFPPEPLSTGMFGRVSASPLWYRGARLLVMGFPTVFWCLTFKL